jgi:multidrug efflux pump subunit AcrA (membrane-fusion protein)
MSEIVKTSSEALPRANAGRTRAQPAPGAVNGAPSGGEGGGGGNTGRTGGAEGGASEFAAVLQEFLAALLERQCRLTGAVVGILYLGASGARQASIGATFVLSPPSGDAGSKAIPAAARIGLDQAMVTRLTRYATDAIAGPMGQPKSDLMTVQSSEARGIYQPDPTHRVLACPLVAADQVHGASVMVVPLSVRMEPTDALERVALTGASYEAFLWRNHCVTEAQTKTRLRETLELLDAAQQSEDAEAMGAIFCHELQRRFGCTRVSIGLIRGSRLRVVGVSGADDLNKHAAVVESLEGVMEECAEQDIEVVFPPPPEDENDPARRRVTRAHAQHSTKFGPAAILSLPLRVSGDLVGVTTMEREPSDPFPAGAVPLLRLAAEFIGPALWTRRMADRGILAVTRDRLSDLASATFGPRHTGAKALVSLILLVFALMAFVPIPGRVTAETETRALVSRTISPPFEGFLEIVNVKPGDVVKAGDVLATLETKDTLVTLTQAGFRLQTMRTQYDHARASGIEGQGEAAIIAARMDEVRGEIELFEDRIARSRIVSPISGVISRGDIEPLAGAKVEPSQPLFEIIVPGKQVIVVQVKEKDIGRVKVGQEGRMAVTALPDTKLPIKVVRVRPVAEPVQKENVFLVEAEIQEDKLDERYRTKPVDTWLKPGMTGTARLESGTTTVLWELCKPLLEAVRMRVWW